MKNNSKGKEKSEPIRRRPALTLEDREDEMIGLAVDLAEQQLRDGTASSQVISHYLKLGSTKNRLEKTKLEEETKLLKAKTEALETAKNMEALLREAITAMTDYSYGSSDEDEYIEEDIY